MTLWVTCKQCGEKNNFTKLIDILRKKGLDLESAVKDAHRIINEIKPRCGNCFIEMTPQQNDTNVRKN